MDKNELLNYIKVCLERKIITYNDLIKILNDYLNKTPEVVGPIIPNQREEEEKVLKREQEEKQHAEELEGENIFTQTEEAEKLNNYSLGGPIIPNQREEEENGLKREQEKKQQAEELEGESLSPHRFH